MTTFAHVMYLQPTSNGTTTRSVTDRSSTPGNNATTDSSSAAPQPWANLIKQVHGPSDFTSEHLEGEDKSNEAVSSAGNGTQSAFTGFSLGQLGGTQLHSLSLRPTPPVIASLCNVYLDQVDRIIKVLHRPSLKNHLLDGNSYSSSRSSITAENALDAAVFHAAVASMTDRQCQSLFHCSRATVLPEYQKACEMSLERADLTRTRDVTVLQAFVLYLVCSHTRAKTYAMIFDIFTRLLHEPTISRGLYGLLLLQLCGLLTHSICMSSFFIHQKLSLVDRCEKGYG